MCEKFSITNGLAEQVAGLCGAAEGSGDNGLMEKLVKERADAKNTSEVLIACTPEESCDNKKGSAGSWMHENSAFMLGNVLTPKVPSKIIVCAAEDSGNNNGLIEFG